MLAVAARALDDNSPMKHLAVALLLAAAPALAQTQGSDWLSTGVARQKAHDLDGAIAAYQKAIAEKQAVPMAMYNLATVYALKKQPDQAIEWLKKAAAAGFHDLATIQKDTDLEELRKDPRWPDVLAALEKATHPCQGDPVHRELDFWVGEWNVFGAKGNHVGTSSVKPILGGCVILESWSGDLGSRGQSFNFWDADRKRWRQTWVDDSGGNLDYVGELEGAAMRFQGETPESGTNAKHRLTFFKLDGGKVRELAEASTDGGKTWVVRYDFTYVRKN